MEEWRINIYKEILKGNDPEEKKFNFTTPYNSTGRELEFFIDQNILNEYCTDRRNEDLEEDTIELLGRSMNHAERIFNSRYENMFRRVEKDSEGNYRFRGNLNISIFESFISTLMIFDVDVNPDAVINSYKHTMYNIFENASNKRDDNSENPFTTSTGTLKSIEKRKDIMKEILI